MIVFINNINVLHSIEVNQDDSIDLLKFYIYKYFKVIIDKQLLFYNGIVLNDNFKLLDYNITNNSIIKLVII